MSTVFLNGEFIDSKDAKISIFDHGFLYGDGIYETLRTYGGLIFNYEAHYKRLKRSADVLKLNLPYSEREIYTFIKELIAKNALKEARIRVTLTRGENNFTFDTCKNPTMVILANELEPEPIENYESGVKVITVPFSRALPEVKSISLVPMVKAKQTMIPKGAYEALFVDADGYITEGSITNVYFVKNNEIHVPEMDMLSGTVREVLLGLAVKAGYSLIFERCYKESFYEADEIFLTNSIRSVIPVSHIDDFPVNATVPGAVTANLIKLWKENLPNLLT